MSHCLQDIIPTDGFESLAEGLSGSFSCLKSFLPSIVSQLGPLLAVLPETDVPRTKRPQPKSHPHMPSADAVRRGADLVTAALCHMPAADVQVRWPLTICFTPANCVPQGACYSRSTTQARLPEYLMRGPSLSWTGKCRFRGPNRLARPQKPCLPASQPCRRSAQLG